MTNYPFETIDDYEDIEAKGGWKERVLSKLVSPEDYLTNLRQMSRDNARTPMHWDGTANGGFTTASKPWLAVNPNHREINAEEQITDQTSVYNFYCKFLELRKRTPALVYGDYRDVDPSHPCVFAYTRTLGSEKMFGGLEFLPKNTHLQVATQFTGEAAAAGQLGAG